MNISRLTPAQCSVAQDLFVLMATVFETEHQRVSEAYAKRLLGQQSFWALAATEEGKLVGGLTAHTLPLTRTEVSEIFI